jgi:DNA-directed RNA polymerase specialized sigma24 family protein
VTAFFARRSREPQTVADLTSDMFVAAMTSFATFDPARGAVRGWLFGIAPGPDYAALHLHRRADGPAGLAYGITR